MRLSATAPQDLHFDPQDIKMKTDENRKEGASFRDKSLLEGPWFHFTESQNHRITESQNSRGWKGPLWVI